MKKIIIAALLAILTIVAGGVAIEKANRSVSTYDDFIEVMMANGYRVEEEQPYNTVSVLSGPLFDASVKYVNIEGLTLTVYEFDNDDIAASEAKSISKTGNRIKNFFFNWPSPPHFFNKGNLIVCYCGSIENLDDDLRKILGKPITN